MALHLIKLCVGADSLQDLALWQQDRKRHENVMHVTRQTPKQAEQLLDGGSLYWVIKGIITARQRLLELRPLSIEGASYCGLVLDPALVEVRPRIQRAFQGWRYLQAKDAPPDMPHGHVDEAMPDYMRRELAAMGLL